ncbi:MULTISPECIES: YeeE/YedE family protein [unclassified Caballeronia]|uniref:YeeE/YedE family protein n=1 Tax=unclassified Caballeronia TaxID=2646786 RepID=UPI001F156B3D|nr:MULTISPECIES: YeeE/YedE family protein [unclassified Caballeronia]
MSSFLAGLLFGLGLIISGMANPAKILGFLDLAGNWDPSLAFVMIGAVAFASVGFFASRRTGKPLLEETKHLPTKKKIDAQLIVGSAIFGVGWGLAGFCPGPVVVAVGAGKLGAVVFLAAMVAGMLAFKMFDAQRNIKPKANAR